MDVPSLSNRALDQAQDKSAQPAPYRGFLSWLFPTPQPQVAQPKLSMQSGAPNSLAHAVTGCWRNCLSEEAPRCWEQIQVKRDVNLSVGNQSAVQAFYTNFAKRIRPLSSLTVVELDTEIYMASYYGAREFDARLWFSAAGNSGIGLVAAKNDSSCHTQFYGFQEMPDGIVPMLIPSHSQPESGHLCIYESNIGQVGVSTWDTKAHTPQRLFHQTGYDDILFFGTKYALGLRRSNYNLECWNLETHTLDYSLAGWCQPNPTFIGCGPFNSRRQILLAHGDQYLYAFDLIQQKFAYHLDLSALGGDGSYHTMLVGDNLLCCRGNTAPHVQVFDIESGNRLYTFEVGGASDFKDIDDFPMCILGNVIAALKENDKKTIYLRNGESGEISKTFGPAPQDITGIYFAEGRLIAACQRNTDHRVENFHDQIIIWDLDSGKLLTTITAPDGYDMSVQDITAGKLTTYLQKFGDETHSKSIPRAESKKANSQRKKKPLETQLKEGIHWTNPDQLQLLDSCIRLEIWDTHSCTHLGSIQEEFTSTEGLPLFVSFESGKLVLDSDLSVLVQYFH